MNLFQQGQKIANQDIDEKYKDNLFMNGGPGSGVKGHTTAGKDKDRGYPKQISKSDLQFKVGVEQQLTKLSKPEPLKEFFKKTDAILEHVKMQTGLLLERYPDSDNVEKGKRLIDSISKELKKRKE